MRLLDQEIRLANDYGKIDYPEVPLLDKFSTENLTLSHITLKDSIEVYGKPMRLDKPLTFNALFRNGSIWMSSTPQECYAMMRGARRMRGSCLVAGLGLGVFAQFAEPFCDNIVVVEKDEEICRHIGPQIETDTTMVVNADFFEYLKKCKPGDFQSAYLDIWDAVDPEYLPYMNYLVTETSKIVGAGPIAAWAYEATIGSGWKGMNDITRHVKYKERVIRKEDDNAPVTGENVMGTIWPVVASVMSWWARSPFKDLGKGAKGYVERFLRTVISDSHEEMFNLEEKREMELYMRNPVEPTMEDLKRYADSAEFKELLRRMDASYRRKK